MDKITAIYQVSEVSPGIWRVVGADRVADSWEENGEHNHVKMQINTGSVSANDGSVSDQVFSFKGVGIEFGTYVEDRSFNPPVLYQYGSSNITKFLDDAFILSDKKPSSDNEEKTQTKIAPKTSPRKLAKESSDIKDSDTPHPKNEIRREKSTIILWILAILALSGFLGFILRKPRKSSIPKKTGSKIISILFLSLLISAQAKSAKNTEYDSPLLADAELNLYETEKNICGAISLYYSLSEIGHKIPLEDIIANIPAEAKGVSLSAMCQYLDKSEVAYQVVKSDSLEAILKTLKPKTSAAILHVDVGTHFLAVKRTPDGRVVAFDGTQMVKENVINELRPRFSGTALIVGFGFSDMLTHFVDWKKIFATIGVIPLGFGMGALVRTILSKGTSYRSFVSETPFLTS